VIGGRVEGRPGNATAELLAGWLTSRCGSGIGVVKSERTPGPSGVDTVYLQLDEDEEIWVQADRRGGAVITQPFRPDTTLALPDRALGDLLGEELRRLDPDEPYSEALEATTGITGLADRSPEREYIWFDPAEADGHAAAPEPQAAQLAPTVPADSLDDEVVLEESVAEEGEHGEQPAGTVGS
jgi:hypothetical protein